MPHERRRWIVQQVRSLGHVSASAARSATGASTATIRRDLTRLECDGLLTRVHGGAVAAGAVEIPEAVRATEAIPEKTAIAEQTVAMLGSASTLGLTGGTTAAAVARALPAGVARRVVTNSLSVAMELIERSEIELVVVGGRARSRSMEMVGELAETAWRTMNVDVAVVGADGVDARRGLTTHDEVEARTNRALVECSARAIAVADGSKLGVVAFAQICEISSVESVVTTDTAHDGAVADLGLAGVHAIIAGGATGDRRGGG